MVISGRQPGFGCCPEEVPKSALPYIATTSPSPASGFLYPLLASASTWQVKERPSWPFRQTASAAFDIPRTRYYSFLKSANKSGGEGSREDLTIRKPKGAEKAGRQKLSASASLIGDFCSAQLGQARQRLSSLPRRSQVSAGSAAAPAATTQLQVGLQAW